MAPSLQPLFFCVLLLFCVSSLASSSLPFDRAACQFPSTNVLSGCPNGTLVVGPSGSGANFTTVQAAVESISQNDSTNSSETESPYVILILPGNYTEQVNVTTSHPLVLLGQTSDAQNVSANTVTIRWSAVAGTGDNAYTAVLTVAPNLDAALTGSGTTGHAIPASQPFGNVDFRAYNLNFSNEYLPYSAGPSLALSVGYANAGFYHVSFASYQDTLYIGKNASVYVAHGVVAGQTDFLYGFGTLWIANSTLALRGCGGGITAWKGTSGTSFENRYGVYVVDSIVRKANSSLSIAGKCALGRPWNSLHRSIFANTYLDNSILPAGYKDWSTTVSRITNDTFMAEYDDRGPGFNLTARLAADITKELSSDEWSVYDAPAKVFRSPLGDDDWTWWIDWDA